MIEELIRAKPSAAKGRYLRSVVLDHHDGPRREGGPEPDPRHRRGAGSPPRLRSTARFLARDLRRRRAPKTGAGGASSRGRDARLRRPPERAGVIRWRAMNRDQKAAVVEELAEEIRGAEAIFAVDYRGISVSDVAELRARLRDAGARFRIVKNSLTERASDKAGDRLLEGAARGADRARRSSAATPRSRRRPSATRARARDARVQGRPDERRPARPPTRSARSRGCPPAMCCTANWSARSPRR